MGGCGQVAAAVWQGSPIWYMAGYGSIWLSMIILLILTVADTAFAYMGAAMFFMYALATAGLRVALRTKLGISGDMVSDCCACCFALSVKARERPEAPNRTPTRRRSVSTQTQNLSSCVVCTGRVRAMTQV